jgi:zinc/manganese transport system substrate-binding protein
MPTVTRLLAVVAASALALSACGDDDDDTATVPSDGAGVTVVATTSILGDVVSNLIGDQADVVTIMPVGASPHDFQASAQQVDQMRRADVLIVNGGGFEEGLLDVIEAAEADGVATYEALAAVEAIEFGAGGHEHAREDHDEEDHDEAEHDGDDHDHADDHAHSGVDPHFFTDPARMAVAVEGIADHLAENVGGIDVEALEASTETYLAELRALDEEVEASLADIDESVRVLVTNHDVFGYFADRYGFEVVGTVIPGGSTADAASARALAELAEVIEHEGVPAIFVDSSAPDALALALAGEVGDVEVVELFSESLGPDGSGGETYLAMVRTNAERIAAALA